MRKPAPLNSYISTESNIVVDTQTWRQWFSSFTDYYESVAKWVDPYHPTFGQVEPPAKYKKTGLQAYADGSSWNPGSGAGLYYWTGSAWKFIA